jgi:cyclopropane fatty-acyl-phospholipid synthase-like methyltransferase
MFMTSLQSHLIADNSIDRAAFEEFYDGKAPWDIGRPQEVIVAIADQVVGPVLDAGCGTGEHALFFAARGLRVIGVDFAEVAVRRARSKAAERGLNAEFLIKDATALEVWAERFAAAIDFGLFHCLSDDDQRRYVRGLSHVIAPGGRLFLVCFSDEEQGTEGPRRVSRRELQDAFAEGWQIESIRPTRIETAPEFTEVKFSEGGPKAWLAIIHRKG